MWIGKRYTKVERFFHVPHTKLSIRNEKCIFRTKLKRLTQMEEDWILSLLMALALFGWQWQTMRVRKISICQKVVVASSFPTNNVEGSTIFRHGFVISFPQKIHAFNFPIHTQWVKPRMYVQKVWKIKFLVKRDLSFYVLMTSIFLLTYICFEISQSSFHGFTVLQRKQK